MGNNSLFAQKKEYTLCELIEDSKVKNYDRIVKHNSVIKDSILSKVNSDKEYIQLVCTLYVANKMKDNHLNSLEYAQLYLAFFEQDVLTYGQYYLNGLKLCTETADLLNYNELVLNYTTLGLNYLDLNDSLKKNELLFFLEKDAEVKFELGKLNESILAYRKLILTCNAIGVNDITKISEYKFNLACSYFQLGLYENAESLLKEITNSGNKEEEFFETLCASLIYPCLVLSNRFEDALKYSENLEIQIKKKIGVKSQIYGDFRMFLLANYSGLGEMYLKSTNQDSVVMAKKFFQKANIIGNHLERDINKFQFSKEDKGFIYSTISLTNFFLDNKELFHKYANLSNNKALKTLCFITENNQNQADSTFLELIESLNKEFKVNSKLSIYDNLLLKRKLASFNVTALMNYINYWNTNRPGLVLFAFEKWINFNGNLNIKLPEQKNTELRSLIELKNKIEEGLLTPSKMNILKSCTDSIAYLEQIICNEFTISTHQIKYADIQNLLTSEEAYFDIIEVPNFDFKKLKIIDGKNYNVFIVNGENDTIIHHLLIPSLNLLNFDAKNSNDLEFFYNNFWKPIATKISDKKRIYVSLGGVYNNINLNTLYNPESGKYLLEEKDIHIVNSARDFVLSKEREKKIVTSTKASLYGFPDFNGNSSISIDTLNYLASTRNLSQNWIDSLTRGNMKASPLPGTKIEIENISSTFNKNGWTVSSYTQSAASETNLKKEKSPRVLHIATHGYFFPDVPMEKDNTRFLGMDRQQVVQDPMLRSGLLFAGANITLKGEESKGENGLLSAAEASLLDLRETELVVLSACETGRGEVKNSEGVYGLRKAFSDAGAQNIIMSLWKVDDEVTQEFMSRFYEIWLDDKKSIREAFNKTQLEIKAKYPQPYYWGAFILVGEL